MMYCLLLDESGDYLTGDGKRCTLLCCRRIRTSAGVNEGWTHFATFEECLAAWRLTYAPQQT